MNPEALVKIEFYVPETHLELVKNAMFEEGAGKVGDYDCCAWQVLGRGQFKPTSGSQPFIGEVDALETLDEYKVEMVCRRAIVKDVIGKMKERHPYEEVAYSVYEIIQGY